ncbi:MAG: helix-turn-helix domain-containing protein, partial [Candidatus Chisholmbacteria bacterium]|nr:helix-turn-helix domain-containing protein [Candidatus Chisholmbacteria bacterium]
FLTVREVAQILKLNTLTIYDYIRAGRLSAVRFGRYYRIAKSDFSAFLKNQRVKP